MDKETIRLVVTEAVKALALVHKVTENQVAEGLLGGHVKLTSQFKELFELGMSVVSGMDSKRIDTKIFMLLGVN